MTTLYASFTRSADGQIQINQRMSTTGHYRGGFVTRSSISQSSWNRLYRLFCDGRSSHGNGWYSFRRTS